MDHHEFLFKEKTDEIEEQNLPHVQHIEHPETNMQRDRNDENRPDVSNESYAPLPPLGSALERHPFAIYRQGDFFHHYNSEGLFGNQSHVSDTAFEEIAYLSPTAGIRQIACDIEGNMASDGVHTNAPDFFETMSSNLYELNNRITSFGYIDNQVGNESALQNDPMTLPLSLELNIMDSLSYPTDTTDTLEMNSLVDSIIDEIQLEQNTTIVDPRLGVDDEGNRVSQADEVAFYAEDEDSFENALTMHTENSPIKSDNLIRKNLCYGSSDFVHDFNQPSSSAFQAGNNIDTKTVGYKNARVPTDEDDPEEINSIADPQAQFQVKDRRFTCQECGKRFSFQSRLRVHTRIHTGEKPFACNHCKKRFADQSNLTAHSRIHTGEKPYVCKNCNKGFADKSNLTRHSRIHTGAKPYECSKCDKKYSHKHNLTKHYRKHTEEEPFKCRICGQVFWDENTLNVHKAIHR